MDVVRAASPEEIAAIAEKSDLGPGCAVVAFGEDRAVLRQITELDPMYCASLRRKLILKSHIETYLRLSGVPAYYFNILETDTEFQDVVKQWGAVQTSVAPEFRFKMVL